MSVRLAEPLVVWADHSRIAAFGEQTLAAIDVESRKLLRDPSELFSRAVQPVLWLLVFGQVFSRVRGIATGPVSYIEFMAPGVLAQSILFGAIFYGIAVIWERDLGIVHKLLVSPAYRLSLVLGKALAAGTRGLAQAIIIYILAVLMGVRLRISVPAILGVVLIVVLGSATFSTFSLVIACIVKTRERFMGIGQVLTMPLFFASNAIYPLSLMPQWLHTVALLNPLTYVVDALRMLMLQNGTSVFGLGIDALVVMASFLVLLAIAQWRYPTLAQ
ncbi:MAG: ABC transporter permease [Thermoanaerobaculia bacterium]